MIEPQSRQLDLQDVELSADLRLPLHADGLVIFVHGSGSGRLSPRNQFVAESLARRGLGSLLFDLLTEPEQRLDNLTGELRFDIALLARRLVEVIDWVGRDVELHSLRIGLFGASTGAAAALLAAAVRPEVVMRWSAGEGAPTWRVRHCRRSGRPLCRSLAPRTRWCSN